MRPQKKNSFDEKIPIGLAIQQAKKSPMNFRIGAVLFSGREILGCGHNYHNHWMVKNFRMSVHAEADAMIGLRHDMIRKADMVIIRIGRAGDILPGTPCKKCSNLLARKGIKRVYCFDENLNFVAIHP